MATPRIPLICPPQNVPPSDEGSRLFCKPWWLFFQNIVNWIKALFALNVTDFGAVGDALLYADGAVGAGSRAFSSNLAGFTSDDVGKSIVVIGAGVAGATLVTRIAAVTGGHSATLTDAATTAVSGVSFVYGTDNTAAFKAAVDAVTSGRQRVISIPRATGGYLTVGTIAIGTGRPAFLIGGATWYAAATLFSITQNTPAFPPLSDGGCVSVTGDGVKTSRVIWLLKNGNAIQQTQINGPRFNNFAVEALAPANTATAFNLTTNYNARWSDLHILKFDVGINLNGTDIADGTGRGAWFYFRDVFIHEFTSAGLMSSHSVELMPVNLNCYAAVNNPTGAYGVILDTDTSGINCKNVIMSFCGMMIRNTMGNVASVWGIPPEFIYGDTVVADSMPTHGIHFHSSLAPDALGRAGKSYHFVNSWAAFTTVDDKDGVLIEAGQDISFTDIRARVNRRHGIHITGGTHIRINNPSCLGNNFQNAANGSGIYIEGAGTGRVSVLGGLCGDNVAGEGSGFQHWGIYVKSDYVAPHMFHGIQYDGNQTGPISDNSPASYQQHFGFMDLTGGDQIHKLYLPKGRFEFGDGNFYLDFKHDLANAVALVFGPNRMVRFLRTGTVLEIISGILGGGGEVQIISDLLRTQSIYAQDVAGFNVAPEAGWSVKAVTAKFTTSLRLPFVTSSVLATSGLGDVIAGPTGVNKSTTIVTSITVSTTTIGYTGGATNVTFVSNVAFTTEPSTFVSGVRTV